MGVRRNGRYVLGRPRLSTVVRAGSTTGPDDTPDPHRIERLGPLQKVPQWESYRTADEARDAYRRMVAGDSITPLQDSGVWKARLVLDGRPVEERLVVRTLPQLFRPARRRRRRTTRDRSAAPHPGRRLVHEVRGIVGPEVVLELLQAAAAGLRRVLPREDDRAEVDQGEQPEGEARPQ